MAETQKFNERIEETINQKFQQNYSASYHYSMGLIKKLYATVENPLEGKASQQFDALLIHDYIRKWVNLVKEYKELGKCAI